MAKVRRNLIVRGLSGKIGSDLVFRQMANGQTIVQARPDFSKRVLSKDQKAHHEKFKAAAAYARKASCSQPIYAKLAKGTVKNAYNIALGDWFNPPVIHSLERRGETIRIQASDDVCVAGVRVTILDDKGKALEYGEATQVNEDWWEYNPRNAGVAVVEAKDLAGNVVNKMLQLKLRAA